MSDSPILPSVSIAALLQRRDEQQEALRRFWSLLAESDEIAKQAGFGSIAGAMKAARMVADPQESSQMEQLCCRSRSSATQHSDVDAGV